MLLLSLLCPLLPLFQISQLSLDTFNIRELSAFPLNRYYGTVGNDYGTYLCNTSDGGYLITATTDLNGNLDILAIKVNASGDIQWSRTIGGASD